jgi:hypothetical protein
MALQTYKQLHWGPLCTAGLRGAFRMTVARGGGAWRYDTVDSIRTDGSKQHKAELLEMADFSSPLKRRCTCRYKQLHGS